MKARQAGKTPSSIWRRNFWATTRYILAIRDRLSPATKIDTDELGVILPTDGLEIQAKKALRDHIPHVYWNAAGALYADLFVELSKMGVGRDRRIAVGRVSVAIPQRQ